MKKVSILMVIIAMFLLVGCSTAEINENEDTHPITEDVTTYIYSGNVWFAPINTQNVYDGTFNGVDITTYVDLNTGVMYVFTSRFHSGYDTTWEMLVNADGTPAVYENLDELRDQYDWNLR